MKIQFISGQLSTEFFQESISPKELSNHLGEFVTLHGSIYKIRKMSGFAFVLLRTPRQIISCIYGEFSEFNLKSISEESCVKITAIVHPEPRAKQGFELRLKTLQILSSPVEQCPIVIHNKELPISLETCLDYRPISLRNEKNRAIFQLQAGICSGIRHFLDNHEFTEIHTPKLGASGAEGGATLFTLPYFGKEACLAQSPQFYKQILTGVYERVYEIAPVFRAEKHDTSRHLNEYTSVDVELGYLKDFAQLMQLETVMLSSIFSFLSENYKAELELLSIHLPKINQIPVIRFSQAKSYLNFLSSEKEDLSPEEERLLCEKVYQETGSEFIFVTHYPTKKRPFYAMENPENREETLSFDLLFRGMEITTGGQRIHSYEEQLAKIRRLGMDEAVLKSYLMIHRYGIAPHGGFGLGLERFLTCLAQLPNVRYGCLFPRDIHRLTP